MKGLALLWKKPFNINITQIRLRISLQRQEIKIRVNKGSHCKVQAFLQGLKLEIRVHHQGQHLLIYQNLTKIN
jgi:hypothetical protein